MSGRRPIVPCSSPSPHRRPIRYPAESPITAPDTAAAMTAHSGTVPRQAATPPKITATSPGKTNPTNAEASSAGTRNTRASTSHPGSVRILSTKPAARAACACQANAGIWTSSMTTQRILRSSQRQIGEAGQPRHGAVDRERGQGTSLEVADGVADGQVGADSAAHAAGQHLAADARAQRPGQTRDLQYS